MTSLILLNILVKNYTVWGLGHKLIFPFLYELIEQTLSFFILNQFTFYGMYPCIESQAWDRTIHRFPGVNNSESFHPSFYTVQFEKYKPIPIVHTLGPTSSSSEISQRAFLGLKFPFSTNWGPNQRGIILDRLYK